MSEVKILICDDDPDLQGLLLRRLKKMGIEPDVAGDGRQAKAFVDDHNYDVIIADIYMPEATGLEVMQHAKQKDADTQVVIITSSATLDNAIDALNHGAFGYLTKPFDHLIVFDNMVSRALEYRTLLVADKRKAEAQKRRGDMLEDEVADRVQQLQKKQKGLLDLLGSLPDGILVVEEGGKVVLSSPVGERWLAQDRKSEEQPIQFFMSQVHSETPKLTADVRINEQDLHLMATDFPDDGEVKRRAVIIREVEVDSAGAGSMVTETVMGIKKGLATLYEQGMGTEVVLNVASQFAVLEQLQGWSVGTGELSAAGPAPAQASAEAAPPEPAPQEQGPAPPADSATEHEQTEPASQEQNPAPAADSATEPEQTKPASQEQNPAPPAAAPAQTAAGAGEVTSIPPFTLPRERTPTGELDGPRLNTSELQNALRAAAPPDAQQDAAEHPLENAILPDNLAAPVETQAAQTSRPGPMDDTLVAKPSRKPEAATPEEPIAVKTPPPARIPDEATAQPEDPAPAEASVPDVSAPSAAAPTEIPASAEAPIEEQAPIEAAGPSPSSEVEWEPNTQSAEATVPDEEPAPDPELSSTEGNPAPQPEAFPQAEAGTGDVPSWIKGIKGTTDLDLLADFEFEPEQPEPTFPRDQTGNLEDDSMYRARVIPEEINAKLDTPVELPKPNGDQEYAPPEHEGPITIQASEADTQIFRKVLEGLSGTQVLSGDYEKREEEPTSDNGDAVAETAGGLDELPTESAEAPAKDMPLETPQAEDPPVPAQKLRQAQEPDPDPRPVSAEPGNWPPTLPTEDEEWDDELDVSG